MRVAIAALAIGLAFSAPALAEQNWQEFKPAHGGFRVEMPDTPDHKATDDELPLHTALVAIDKSVAGADLVFIVKYRARREKPGAEAPGVLDAVVKAMAEGNTILSDKSDPIGGFPAREFTLRDKDKDTYQIRAVLTDRYFVEVLFLGPPDNPLGKRFLDSFQVENGSE